jgi:hypothetical protein
MMSNVIEGTIRGKMIELTTDPGLAEGQAVRVTLKPLPTPEEQRAAILRTAGALAHLPPEDFDVLDQIVRERHEWPERGVSE